MTPQQRLKILKQAVRQALQVVTRPGDVEPSDQVDQVRAVLATALEDIASDDGGRITFVTTRNVFDFLKALISGHDDGSDAHKTLALDFERGHKLTVRRAYVRLHIDIQPLKRLRKLMMAARNATGDTPAGIRRALSRFIKQIDKEALEISALEHLARSGL